MNISKLTFQIFQKKYFQYVQTITQKAIFIICILSPFCVFSEHENFQLQPTIGATVGKFNGKDQVLSVRFKTTVEVVAECVYPHLYGDDSLISYVNKKIEKTAHDRFEKFVEQEKINEEELNDILVDVI